MKHTTNRDTASWENESIVKQYLAAIRSDNNDIAVGKKYYHDPSFFSLFPNLQRGTSLEIGSGDMAISLELKKRYPHVTVIATDLPVMLNEVIKNSKHNLMEIEIIPAIAEDLPFNDNYFDLTMSSLLLHWVEHTKKVVSEMFRVTKSGGCCIISLAHPNTFHVDEREILLRENETYLNKTIGPLTYYKRSVIEYKTLFLEVGFSTVTTSEPVFENEKISNKFKFLKRYKKEPLFLFIKAVKP